VKAETKAKYMGRIDTCRKLLVEAMQTDHSAEIEKSAEAANAVKRRVAKMKEVFGEVIAAQNNLMDGKFINSVDASNTLYQLEIKVKRLGLGAGNPEDDEDAAVPNWNSSEGEEELTNKAAELMKRVADAQMILTEVHQDIITVSPMAALVPAVEDLKQYTKNLTGIMQGLAKVGALL
jgi:hypothetical protein